MNEKGYIHTSYIDMLCLVRAMGLANKSTLLTSLEEDVPGWLQTELDRNKSKDTWYDVPLVIMSQLLHPVKISKTKDSN